MKNSPEKSSAKIKLQTQHEVTPGLEERIDAIITESNRRIEQNQGFNSEITSPLKAASTTIELQTSHEITPEFEERLTALVAESDQRM